MGNEFRYRTADCGGYHKGNGRSLNSIKLQQHDKVMAKTGIKFKVVNDLKLDVLKLEDGQEYLFTIVSPIKLGTPKADGSNEKSADTVQAINLADDKKVVIMLNAVIRSSLQENYPNGEYVGKSFRAFGTGKVKGKRYKGYEFSEITLG